ncbi:multidrug resistance-associated ABC transporter [Crepidotus variabilis]|uniref:Multidrug resistance-associated ABC transporter n=1 Tax=Crepidotus variabilis TaxID=179855 RepID=A0A9P6E4Y2_9AGAR|nr:multidrug resistance-associated ABC transporter [Crepidotus variabilis]
MPVAPAFLYQPVTNSPSYGHLILTHKHIWRNSLCIPAAGAILSLTILFVQLISNALKKRRALSEDQLSKRTTLAQSEGQPESARAKFQAYTNQHGSSAIFAFKFARSLGSIALLVISVLDLYQKFDEDELAGHWHWRKLAHRRNLPQLALIGTYWYTSVLSSLSLIPGQWSQTLARHTNLTLFITFTTYVYRDIWPLATFNKEPIDNVGRTMIWVEIGLLALTAIFIPLFVPRKYIPVDPENPMPVPNPEQTASIFSLVVYSFLDSVILEAYRVPHLSHEKLPPLCDTDYSDKLTSDAAKYLDPFHGAEKGRHIFWRLVYVLGWEYLGMALSIIAMVFASFASPVAVNRILYFLEQDDPDVNIRPWFWVFWLFIGPFLVSVTFQWYIFLGTRALVRTQAILTQLVFDHSLRIRFKAEADGESKSAQPSGFTTPRIQPDDESVERSVEGSTSTDAETVVGHTASTTEQSTFTAVEEQSVKAKAKDQPTKAPAAQKKKDNLVGKINTLVTVDVDNIANAKDFLMFVIQVPLEFILACVFLYIVLGWSALVGLGSIFLLLPVPGYLAGLLQSINEKKMEKTDARVEATTQAINVLRMIKLFGWEKKIKKQLDVAREEELTYLMKDKVVSLANDLINYIIPTITMLVTYSCFTMIAKQPLTPSIIFSSMAVFDVVRNVLYRTSWIFSMTIRGKVSLERISKFLNESELLDNYSEETCTEVTIKTVPENKSDVVGFNNATFSWSKDADGGVLTLSSKSFRLRIPDTVEFKKGKLNLIVGPTGAGKTSILMALLGEMHFLPSSVDSWFNLPREGGVAYAAQESWVQNETIRDNILFGSPYDEERYKKVVSQCALETDLKLFNAGDKTEVGEKGLTLSGGQKARVTLARAVYSSASVVLLDDILAALDVHTARHIVQECLKGDLLHGRTIILVTHNVALCSPIAEHFVAIGIDGLAREISDISELLGKDKQLAEEIGRQEEEAEIEKEAIDTVKQDVKESEGKLILAEEIAEGHVSWKSIKLYLKGLGGSAPVTFVMAWLIGRLLIDASTMFSVWYLGYWGTQYEGHDPRDVSTAHYLSIYSALLFSCCAIYGAVSFFYNLGTQRASRSINSQLVHSVLFSTLRWLDETPASRMITRCTQDIAAIDIQLAGSLNNLMGLLTGMIVKLSGPVFFTPIFIFPGIFVAVAGSYLGNIYLKAQMSVKREQSNARSPMLAHFGAAIAGLISIRAYGSQKPLRNESLKRIDHFTKVSRMSYNLNRWIGIRIDLLGAFFTTALAAYLLANRKINAANTGFSLNMSLEFCSFILYLVRWYNEFEVQANSLERVQAYLDIDHEPEATEAGKPPAAWPTSGELKVERLSARYSPTGPKVLNELSFTVKSGERVGIVGRTGSGKSSLTLSLLRCILTEGSVFLDGIETSKINLDALRSNVTIIPQMPELLSGSLRRNLDPFEQHDDATLNDALRSSGLFALQSQMDEGQLTLDSDVASGGNNLSVGQRQILALARAIVRHSKLLILDEATSAIDHKTDTIIQSTLRNEMSADTTVLTIAHRLQTIMDADKIMVLNNGRIVEFDTPQELLQKKGGQFKALVDGSGDKKALYATVEQKNKANL